MTFSLSRGARLLAAAIAAIVFAHADAAAQQLQAGVRAGVNLANVSVDGDDSRPSFDTRAGLVAGAFVTWQAVSWLQVQPEVLYAAKGASLEQEGIDAQLILDYLEVPLLARVTRRVSGTSVYVVAGPALAWRLGAKSRAEFSGATEEIDLAGDVESFDLGIVAGGGVDVGRFVIDARYTFGVRDIDADRTDAVSMRNRVLSVTAGFRF